MTPHDPRSQWQGLLPSSEWTQHRAVKQRQSGRVGGITYQGKGREYMVVNPPYTIVGPSLLKQARALAGERLMGTATSGGKEFNGRTRVSGERPIGATSFRQ